MVGFINLALSLFTLPKNGNILPTTRQQTRNFVPATITTTAVKLSPTNIINELLDDCRKVSLESRNGIRGVYLKENVIEGETILSVPLKFCLCDDAPPKWFREPKQEQDDDGSSYIQVQDWVTRLTASLVDLQLQSTSNGNSISPLQKAWLNLLPTDLQQILPIHWDDSSLLTSTNCRSLEMAVDSAYFARERIIETLMESRPDIPRFELEACLDLVQTRACRIEQMSDDNNIRPPLRVLGPMFDMINHDRNPNAEFIRGDNDTLLVRALTSIPKKSQVFISYGAASTQPSWRCLFSYGFVPDDEDVYEDDVAELVVDGIRFEINPIEIPFELVQLEAQRDNMADSEDDVVFTPQIGKRIVQYLRETAEDLRQRNEEETTTIACQLAAKLRESNRRTLLACAGGLEEYIEDNLD